MRLVIAGGGTGGHLFPGVAVAEELLGRPGKHEVRFLGAARGIEARLLPTLGLPFRAVRCGALAGRTPWDKMKGLGLTLAGVVDSIRFILRFRPDACLGVGGYASFPAVLAARSCGVVSAFLEPNATPGMANKALSRIVHRIYAGDEAVAAAFPGARTLATGTPLRNALSAPLPYEAPAPGNPVRVLVLGGSQGAQAINRILPQVARLSGKRLEIRHQAGRGREDEVKAAYGDLPGVTVEGFISDMAQAYGWAQIVVARSGALTLAELAATGRPAILIPYPYAAANHQEANARAAQGRGAAVCLTEKEMTPERLWRLIERWIDEPAGAAQAARAAAESARRDAARRIVDDLCALGARSG